MTIAIVGDSAVAAELLGVLYESPAGKSRVVRIDVITGSASELIVVSPVIARIFAIDDSKSRLVIEAYTPSTGARDVAILDTRQQRVQLTDLPMLDHFHFDERTEDLIGSMWRDGKFSVTRYNLVSRSSKSITELTVPLVHAVELDSASRQIYFHGPGTDFQLHSIDLDTGALRRFTVNTFGMTSFTIVNGRLFAMLFVSPRSWRVVEIDEQAGTVLPVADLGEATQMYITATDRHLGRLLVTRYVNPQGEYDLLILDLASRTLSRIPYSTSRTHSYFFMTAPVEIPSINEIGAVLLALTLAAIGLASLKNL